MAFQYIYCTPKAYICQLYPVKNGTCVNPIEEVPCMGSAGVLTDFAAYPFCYIAFFYSYILSIEILNL